MTHVDVVKNEWLAGYQLVVARLRAEGEAIEVDAQEPSWAAVVEQYLREVEGVAAEEFLWTLHTRMTGDYLFATEPHDERECPFHAMVVPFRALETAQERAEHADHALT